MTRIVTTHYRYKRPPRKRKVVEIEGAAVVTHEPAGPPPANDDPKPGIVTTTSKKRLKLLRADRQDNQPNDEMVAWIKRAMLGRGPAK